jgi:hypothetical protein
VTGRVVYAPQGSRWRRNEPLAVGSTVRLGQEIIHLPESGAMSVAIKIDEAHRDKVEEGMAVHITGPNLPDAGLKGKLVRIAEYLDPSGWWNNYLKVYSATVDIEGDASELRTGMNCQTEIIVAFYDDVIAVPLQSVLKVGDEYVVYRPDAVKPQKQVVEIGLDNGRKVHILSGLKAADRILLDPPLAPAEKTDDQAGRQARAAGASPKATTQPSSRGEPDRAGSDGERRRPRSGEGQGERGDRQGSEQGRRGQGGVDRMLQQLVRSGMLDQLTLDETTKAKLRRAAEDAQAGKAVELDEATREKLREAFRKMRQSDGGQSGQE